MGIPGRSRRVYKEVVSSARGSSTRLNDSPHLLNTYMMWLSLVAVTVVSQPHETLRAPVINAPHDILPPLTDPSLQPNLFCSLKVAIGLAGAPTQSVKMV